MSQMGDMRMGGGRDGSNQRSYGSSSRQQKDLDPFGSVVDSYDDDYYADSTSSLQYLLPPTTKNMFSQKTMKSGSSAYSGVQSPSTFSRDGITGSRWESNDRVMREVAPYVYEEDRRRSPRGRRNRYEEDRYDRPRGRGAEYGEERFDRPPGRSERYEGDRYDRQPGRSSRYEDDRYDRSRRGGPAYEDDYDRVPGRGPRYEDDAYGVSPRRGSPVGEFGRHERHRKRYADDRDDRDFYEDDRFYEDEERFGRNMRYADRRRDRREDDFLDRYDDQYDRPRGRGGRQQWQREEDITGIPHDPR